MILIVDSGSFKTDWVFLSSTNKIQFQTIGLHPYFINSKDIHNQLSEIGHIKKYKDQVRKVFFYGAGCNSKENKNIIYKILKKIFREAKIQIDSDLLGAAKALYHKQRGIACILGTGSNCCFYDGENITRKTPSLGYILGDEGSGAYMGKLLLKKYLYSQLPAHLENQLKNNYQLTHENILQAVYHDPFPNRYIAQFSKFISDYKNEKAMSDIIYYSIEEFFINHILKLSENKQNTIRFTGSIAWYFKDFIFSIAKNYSLSIDQITQTPIERLIELHKKEIL